MSERSDAIAQERRWRDQARADHVAEVQRRGYGCACRDCATQWMRDRALDPFPVFHGEHRDGVFYYRREPFPGSQPWRPRGRA